jgi:hypothetical protein
LSFGLISVCWGIQKDPDLVGWWNFDEGSGSAALDLSPQANHGTLRGNPQWTAGVLNGALEFDGGADYVEIPHSPSLSITEAITIAAWIYMGESASGEMAIVSKGSWAANNLPYELTVTPRDVIFWQFYDSEGRDGCAPASPPVSEWHHIAATYDGTVFKCYIDGVFADEWDYAGTMPENNAAVTIGRRSGGGTFFEGMIDDVALFRRALAENEILVVMAGGVAPEFADDPNPEDQAADVSRDVMLRWTPGQYAQRHDVYLGMAFDDVNDADRTHPPGVWVGRDLEDPVFDPGRLDFATTYYWRVDEVNAPPDRTVFKGAVWTFEVEPVSYAVPVGAVTATASSMDPAQDIDNIVNASGLNQNDEHSNLLDFMWLTAAEDATPWIQFAFAQVQTLDRVHIWNHNTQTEAILGFGIKEASIAASIDGDTWRDLGTFELPQATGALTYTGFDLALNGTMAQFIKVTALSNHSRLGLPQHGLSEVRFYAVPMRARLAIPATGSTGLDPLVDLSWRAGRQAARHEVRLGTDPEALTLAATVDYRAYTAAVDLGSTVYWQVNEVNDAMNPPVWEGDLWSFDTAPFVTVDDMERYQSQEGSYIWETWSDGFDDAGNGALLGHNSDDMETDIVYDGRQALPYYYGQGGAGHSEASRDINRDWGRHGIASLSLMFYGDPANVPGQMFIEVNGQRIATYADPSDLTRPQWQAWTIDLPASALGEVQSLTIGFEGGSGMVIIDAIRLYPELN